VAVKPILDDLELQLVQQIEANEHQVRAQHAVPTLEGDFLQPLGRRAERITLNGILTDGDDESVSEKLKKLREKFRAAQPVPFAADIATATKIDTVLIEEMSVRELAGKPERFEYAFALREYIPAPPPEQEKRPPTPEPLVTTLIVEVIVEGQPGFDFSKVTVTVEGTKEDGSTHNVTLSNRSNNIWTEEDFPPGSYTAKAVVTDPPSMSGSVAAEVREGQKTQVTIILRSRITRAIAKAFVVHFRFDKAFIEPCMRKVLNDVARHAAENPEEKMLIVGHTDEMGTDNYNLSLGDRRARSVFAYLNFGNDPAGSLAEWNEMRRPQTGAAVTIRDNWSVRQYQYMLEDLGFLPGNVDGDHGDQTDMAVQNFRAAKGLPPGTTVDDAVWAALIEDYHSQEPQAVPANRFLQNASNGCDGGPLKWLSCGEQMPLPTTPLAGCASEIAWRPNRRVEILFITETSLPCKVPPPVTFNITAPSGTPVGTTWCLGPGDPAKRCCFITRNANDNTSWLIQPIQPDTIRVTGSIRRPDGTGIANTKFVLVAPDGEFMNGERPCGEKRGTPNPSVTDANGTFDFSSHSPTPVGIYTIEVELPRGNHVAHLASRPPSTGRGSIVCAHLDTNHSVLDVIVFAGLPVPAIVNPSITLAQNFVIVKKPHTNPARVQVTLRADSTFTGTGTLDRSGNTTAVRLFTADTDGTEITFNGTDNGFASAALVAGVNLFAEAGPAPSGAINDYTLTLTLNPTGTGTTVGAPATATLTAVLFTLDIFLSRPVPAAPPPVMSEVDKINVGRHVQFRDPSFTHERTMITVRQPVPNIPVTLELLPQNGRVQAFTQENPAAGQAQIPNPQVFATNSIPAAGSTFFVEGVTVSTALRDTGYLLRVQGTVVEVDRVAMTVVLLEIINQSNTIIPRQGDQACLMVSKFVTDVNLPDTATFAGPPGANPDAETFRVQLKGIPVGETPKIRLEILRGANTPYTHSFDMINGLISGQSVYRTSEHIRLVSNNVDDAHLAHQTPLVKLEDIVRATLLLNNQDIARLQLPVGRPPAENGPKAIRTVDIHFVTLQGVTSDPAATIERMNENWAQLAIRFNLVSEETRPPVTNVLTVDGTANANGQLNVDITPQGGATVNVIVAINQGDNESVIAQKLAAAISTNPGLIASHHRHQDRFIVMVNKGQEVTFANINSTVASVVFQEPALNFTDEINLLEGSVLGLNFKDNDPKTIDIIAVGQIPILGTTLGSTGGDFLATNLPGWHNVSIIREEGVGTTDPNRTAGHEMGHSLFDGGNNIHSNVGTNLFRATADPTDTINSAKRLANDPNDPITDYNARARQRSGPNTVPPLLQKK
jgi:outer membrane protein OmpA-like peptidoglycan-associated protein